MKATLLLENGSLFIGDAFGATGETCGEVVFNTSMSGYQEILTDPSYAGQIVTMTYPLIGNYGTNDVDIESAKPRVSGFVVKEYSGRFSNWRANKSLHQYLAEHNIMAVQGIDTRMLTKSIRSLGAMRGIMSTEDHDPKSLMKKVKASPEMNGLDLATLVTTSTSYVWTNGQSAKIEDSQRRNELRTSKIHTDETSDAPSHRETESSLKKKFHVVVYDYGVKYNILRQLAHHGCELTVVSAAQSAEETLAMNPDGIFLSNGPGDPAAVTHVIENLKKLIGKKPMFGICLGHQLLSLAFGAKTYKLKFGHRGVNHPVLNLQTRAIEITSQNHGFAVDADSLPSNLELTHINLNDQTVEGFRHKDLPIFCVQYHPEASPGPHDSRYLFREFVEMMGK